MVAEPSHPVFLSYASQDAKAAQKICEALRAAGIEVFLDQSELRGGDVWDQKIRREIHECALFIPVISANTASRHEGYFRLEWDLADQRSHMMARSRVFVLPVCLDATTESAADVPESFKRVQWTLLPGGETPCTFVQRVRSLLSPESSISARPQNVTLHAVTANTDRLGASARLKQPLLATVVVMVLAALTYLVADKFWISKQREVFAASPAASTSIAEKSVAVLPFSDMSEKHDQEYFSDGLAEEVIDHLTKVHSLYVPARTSSFYFKGKQTTIAEIAKALGVAQVLEGSVRKSGSTLRITAQLIRADTGYHLWSETYDRKLDDIFKVQDEIATEVVKALALSLGAAPRNVKSANGPAYTLYLQGRSIYEQAGSQAEEERGIKLVQQAITLDPSFAPAWALLSRVRVVAYENGTGASDRDEAGRAAEKAVRLDPTLAEAHLAMARVHLTNWAWKDAQREFDRAFELDRGNATVWRNAAYWSWDVGRWQEAEQRMAMATELDPLNYYNFLKLGEANYCAGNLVAAEGNYRKALALQPRADFVHGDLALVLLATGKPQAALTELNLESEPRFHDTTLPRVLDALGRKADGDRAAADAEARYGEAHPHEIAVMYASRRDLQRAFMWWDRAVGRDGEIAFLKLSVPWSGEPELAQDARFRALLRRINSPG